jgi:peptidoglycan/xylan/chitin deacetylase (PgdA/CDA1 family)
VPFGGENQAELALTFDDGPDPNYTPRVLEILNQYGVKATFFVVGSKAVRHPDLLREIVSSGHDLGNHSYAHNPPWFQLPVTAYNDHMKTNRVIAELVGKAPAFARAPWGFPNAGQLWAIARSGQIYVPWTVHSFDWRPGISPDEIYTRVLMQASSGSVVLLHDGRGYPGNPENMIATLPRMIDQLQAKFRLVPLRHWRPVGKRQGVSLRDADSMDVGQL